MYIIVIYADNKFALKTFNRGSLVSTWKLQGKNVKKEKTKAVNCSSSQALTIQNHYFIYAKKSKWQWLTITRYFWYSTA